MNMRKTNLLCYCAAALEQTMLLVEMACNM